MRLLADLRELFTTTTGDRLATAAIIRYLTALADGPWADYAHGQPLTPRQLATQLAGFGIRPKQIRQGADTRKGYMRADFTDAFSRYLPPVLKHPTHRDGPAAFAIPTGSRGSGTVSGEGQSPRREPKSNVSDVSDVHARDRGAHDG